MFIFKFSNNFRGILCNKKVTRVNVVGFQVIDKAGEAGEKKGGEGGREG